MNEQESYTQSIDVAPVDPEREFAQAQKSPVYGGGGISGSQARGFHRDAYESGGSYDNVMRQRERAADPFGMRNLKVDSRSMARTNYANMDIKPPAEVLKAGGTYG